MTTLAIDWASTSSSRLPRKLLLPLLGPSLILFQFDRLRRFSRINLFMFATPSHPTDDFLVNHVAQAGVTMLRGALNDVLKRFMTCLPRWFQAFELTAS